MNITLKKRLHDAMEACTAIKGFTKGIALADYTASLLLRSAVERQVEILGEALHHAVAEDASLEKSIPELRRIVGMRNRIIHGYDSVDDEIVWDAVQHHIPALLSTLRRISKP